MTALVQYPWRDSNLRTTVPLRLHVHVRVSWRQTEYYFVSAVFTADVATRDVIMVLFGGGLDETVAPARCIEHWLQTLQRQIGHS